MQKIGSILQKLHFGEKKQYPPLLQERYFTCARYFATKMKLKY